jgi:hypothetical protein
MQIPRSIVQSSDADVCETCRVLGKADDVAAEKQPNLRFPFHGLDRDVRRRWAKSRRKAGSTRSRSFVSPAIGGGMTRCGIL